MPAPDPDAEYWTTTDIANYLGVQVATVSSYHGRNQMPAPDITVGRTHGWLPARIRAWRDPGKLEKRRGTKWTKRD